VPDIKKQVREYVVDNFLMGHKADDLTDETSFLAHTILDSTGFLELVAFLEEAFTIEILDEEMIPDNLDSLNAIEAFVKRKLTAGRTICALHA